MSKLYIVNSESGTNTSQFLLTGVMTAGTRNILRLHFDFIWECLTEWETIKMDAVIVPHKEIDLRYSGSADFLAIKKEILTEAIFEAEPLTPEEYRTILTRTNLLKYGYDVPTEILEYFHGNTEKRDKLGMIYKQLDREQNKLIEIKVNLMRITRKKIKLNEDSNGRFK